MLFMLMLLCLSCDSDSLRIDREALSRATLLFEYDNNNVMDYQYPRSSRFRKGDFEIKRVEIRELKDDYVVAIEIANNFTNDLSLPNGWDKQVFDIYLFTDNKKHNQAINGRNIKFEDKWEKSILVSPLRKSILEHEIRTQNVEVYDDESDIENLASDIYIPDLVKTMNNVIYIKLSKDSFEPVMLNLEGVQVFALNLDPYPVDISVREVKEYPTLLNFGGGSYGNSHTNVVSMLGKYEDCCSKGITKRVFSTIPTITVKRDQ